MKKDRFEEARVILELLHPGEHDAVDSELEDIKLSLSMSTKRGSLKDLFTMGPQRIFHRVMLASTLQIMLQVIINVISSIQIANNLVYRSQCHCFLHPHHLRRHPTLPRSRGWCALGSISSLYHSWRDYMFIYCWSLREKSPPASLRRRNVYLPRLCYRSRIFRESHGIKSGSLLFVCFPVLTPIYNPLTCSTDICIMLSIPWATSVSRSCMLARSHRFNFALLFAVYQQLSAGCSTFWLIKPYLELLGIANIS